MKPLRSWGRGSLLLFLSSGYVLAEVGGKILKWQWQRQRWETTTSLLLNIQLWGALIELVQHPGL